MSAITEQLADKLAQDTIKAAEELGDDNLIAQMAKVIGDSSTTTQEAFMTAIRVRLSDQRARAFLAEKIAKGPANPAKRGLSTGKILDATEDTGH